MKLSLIPLSVLLFICMCACQQQPKNNSFYGSSSAEKFAELNEMLTQSLQDNDLNSDCTIVDVTKKIKRKANNRDGLEAIGKLEQMRAERKILITSLEEIKGKIRKDVAGFDPRTGLLINPMEEIKLESLMIGVSKEGLGWKLEQNLKNFTQRIAEISGVGKNSLPFLVSENISLLCQNDHILRNKHFVEALFSQTPAVAALVIITHKQNEILRTESIAIQKIANDILHK